MIDESPSNSLDPARPPSCGIYSNALPPMVQLAMPNSVHQTLSLPPLGTLFDMNPPLNQAMPPDPAIGRTRALTASAYDEPRATKRRTNDTYENGLAPQGVFGDKSDPTVLHHSRVQAEYLPDVRTYNPGVQTFDSNSIHYDRVGRMHLTPPGFHQRRDMHPAKPTHDPHPPETRRYVSAPYADDPPGYVCPPRSILPMNHAAAALDNIPPEPTPTKAMQPRREPSTPHVPPSGMFNTFRNSAQQKLMPLVRPLLFSTGRVSGLRANTPPVLPPRPPSPEYITILSSSPPEAWAALDDLERKPKIEPDSVLEIDSDLDVADFEPIEISDDEDEVDSFSIINANDSGSAGKTSHLRDRYPGGPKYVSADERTELFSTSRFRKRKLMFEEGLAIEFYCKGTPPSQTFHRALLAGKGAGKNKVFHKSLTQLSGEIFNGSRTPSSLHGMIRDIAQTYASICVFNRQPNTDFDYHRPDDELVDEVGVRLAELQTRYPPLKTLTAWRIICYMKGGDQSWQSKLHAHLQEHATYSGGTMRSGAISPLAGRIGTSSRSQGSHNETAMPVKSKTDKGKAREDSSPHKSGAPAAASPAVVSDQAINPPNLSAPSSPTSGTHDTIEHATTSSNPKSILARTGNRITNRDTRKSVSTHDHSVPNALAALEALRDNRAARDDQTLELKKAANDRRYDILEAERIDNAKHQEKTHQLELRRVSLEEQKTQAEIDERRLQQWQDFLIRIRDGGKKDDSDPLFDSANTSLQSMVKQGNKSGKLPTDSDNLGSDFEPAIASNILNPQSTPVPIPIHPQTRLLSQTPGAGSSRTVSFPDPPKSF